MFGIFKNLKRNSYLSMCATAIGMQLRVDGEVSKELKEISGWYMNDYHPLFEKAQELGYREYFASLYVATTILEKVATQDFDSMRTNYNSDNSDIILITARLANIAWSISQNTQQKLSWMLYISIMTKGYPELLEHFKNDLENDLNRMQASQEKPLIPF